MHYKNTIVAVALALIAGGSAAQSNVTVFGVLDANLRHVKTGNDSTTQLGTDGLAFSRLGFRGFEDLGGGLRAGFWLEHGMFLDTGTQQHPTKFWNRRATVSLLSNTLGELRLGRDYVPTFWNFVFFDPFNGLGLGASMNLVAPVPLLNILGSGTLTAVRADNAVGYLLPGTLGGLYGQAMVSAGEGTPGAKYRGARLGYAQGALDAALAYSQTYTATPDHLKQLNAGLSYNFGVVKLMGIANRSEFGSRRLVNLQIGAVGTFGQHEARAAFHHANASGAGTDANDARQVALGYTYHLSKRTALYANVSRINNDGATNFTVAPPPVAAPVGRSTGYETGVRHAF